MKISKLHPFRKVEQLVYNNYEGSRKLYKETEDFINNNRPGRSSCKDATPKILSEAVLERGGRIL